MKENRSIFYIEFKVRGKEERYYKNNKLNMDVFQQATQRTQCITLSLLVANVNKDEIIHYVILCPLCRLLENTHIRFIIFVVSFLSP